jgi:cytochrome P450
MSPIFEPTAVIHLNVGGQRHSGHLERPRRRKRLREEAQQVLQEHGEWSKAALAKLHRLDSAIRESARVSAIGGNALARRVKVDGFTLPNGLAVAKNSTIGVSMDGIHFDPEYYDNPTVYDPFRFSRPREELAAGKTRVNEDLVTTSVHWLPFSHGLHAW